MPVPLSPRFEQELFDRQRRRREKRYTTGGDPTVGKRMADIRALWPNLSSGLVMGLASIPIPLDHPYVKRVAEMGGKNPPGQLLTPQNPSGKKKVAPYDRFDWNMASGRNQAALDTFFAAPGKHTSKAERWQNLPDKKKRELYDVWQQRNNPATAGVLANRGGCGEGGGGGFSLGALNPGNLLAGAQSGLASAAGTLASTASDVAGNVSLPDLDTASMLAAPIVPLVAPVRATISGVQALGGNSPVEAVTSGALPGRDMLAEIGGLIGGTEAVQDFNDKWDDTFGKVVKPVVRWGAAAAQAPMELLSGRARAIASGDLATAMPLNPLGLMEGIQEVPGLWDQLTVGQAQQGKSLGRGYLPGGEAVEAQAKAARANSPYLPGGHAWTPGRGLSDVLGRVPGLNEIYEPDSFAWNLTSGLVDAAVMWKLDPAVLVGKGSTRLRESARSVQVEEHGKDVARAFETPKGKKLLGSFVNAQSVDDVRAARGTGLSDEAAQAIADTTDPELIKRVVANDTVDAQVAFLQEAGAHYNWKRWTHPLTQKEWLAGDQMTSLKNDIIDINRRMTQEIGAPSPAEIKMRMGAKFPGVAPDGSVLWTELSQAETHADIDNVLYRHLGLMEQVPGTSKTAYQFRRATKDVRKFGLMPDSGAFMTDDIAKNADQIDRVGLNAKLPWNERRAVMDEYLKAPLNAPNRGNIVNAQGALMERSMIQHGLEPEMAKKASRFYQDRATEHATFIANNVADADEGFYMPGFVKDGEPVNFAQNPLTEADFLNSVVPMPDVREIRQATSFMAPLMKHPAVTQAPEELLEWVNRQWKFFTLARPAWPVRVVGEGQARIVASGLDSFANHPLGAFLTVIGTPESRLANFFERHGLGPLSEKWRGFKAEHGRYTASATGTPLAEEEFITDDILNQGFAQIIDPYQRSKKAVSYFDEVPRTHEQAHKGLTWELGRRSDSVMRRALSGESPDAVKEWFWSGEGKTRREYLASSENLSVMRDNRQFSDTYIDGQYDLAERVTGGDDRLKEALKTGRIDDERLVKQGRVNPKAERKVRAILDEGAGPAKVKVDLSLLQPSKDSWWSRTTSRLMHELMGGPENVLNRNPTARQIYWDEIDRLSPYLKHDEFYRSWKEPGVEAPFGAVDDVTRRGLRPLQEVGTAHQNLGAYTDTVYHEGSYEQMEGWLPGTGGNGRPGSEIWAASTPDLALGQGTNKGVLVELDAKNLHGQVNTEKAGWEFSYGEGQAEFKIPNQMNTEADYRNAVRSITVKPDAKFPYGWRSKVNAHFSGLEKQGWTREVLDDGSVKLTRPGVTPKEAAAVIPDVVKGKTNFEELMENAHKANLPKDMVQRIADRARLPVDPELQLSLDQITQVAESHTVKKSLDILYDLGRRHQFWDQVRFVAPFGEAWHEVLTRWANIYWHNPAAVRHTQMLVEGARDSPMGFFHKNDFGEDVMSYPGSQWLNENVPQVGIGPAQIGGLGEGAGGFEFNPKGLNILGEMLPGVGWAGQLAAKSFIPDTPDWDWARKRIFPFGEPEDTGNPLYDAFETAGGGGSFIRRVAQAFTDPDRYRTQGSLVHHALEQLTSTGGYDLDGPDARAEKKRLDTDAKELASRMALQRAIVGAVVPAAPSYNFRVKDKGGKIVDRNDLYQDWVNDRAKYDSYDEALFHFAKDHGDANLMITQAFSEPQRGHLPLSVTANKWIRKNGALADAHPEVYGYLSPGYDDPNFDSENYDRQFVTGERTYRTAEERIEALNDTKASYLYRRMQEELGDPSEKDRVRLAQYRDFLRKNYPGYDPRFLTGDTEQEVGLIRIMMDDPKARKAAAPGVTRAADKYLKMRERARGDSEGKNLEGEADSERRAYLYQLGNWLTRKYPNFANMWDNVLRYEVQE